MKKRLLRYLLQVTGKRKKNIVLLALLQIALGGSSVLNALALKEILNAAVKGDRTVFGGALCWFACLLCFQIALRLVGKIIEESTRASIENRLKHQMFMTILKKDFGRIEAIHSGEWMTRLTNDTVVVANQMTELLPGFCGVLVRLVSAVLMLVALEPDLLSFVLPGGIVLVLFSMFFRKPLKRLHKNVQEQDENLRKHLQDCFQGLIVIHAYGAAEKVGNRVEANMKMHQHARMKKSVYSNLCNAGFSGIMNLASVLGAMFCGYRIITGSMDYGSFLAILQLIGQIKAPFAGLGGFLPGYYSMMTSAERLTEVEKLPDRFLCAGEADSQTDFDEIGLDHVTFSYPQAAGMETVLQNFSICLKKGEYVAITGLSGCGKSTVLKLMMNLYSPESGECYVCRNGRRESAGYNHQRFFSYVPQVNCFMRGTIREIVSFADVEAKEQEDRLWRALRIACAEEFVKELEDGLDSLLGEKGHGLSEGQIQRLAIARAIFSERPVLILDEATSALDEKTEQCVLENLRAMKDKTVLLVTHRLKALEICDKVIEMENEREEVRKQKNG